MMDLKTALTERLQEALEIYVASSDVVVEGAAPDLSDVQVSVEIPRNTEHGDFATNLAMQLTKRLRRNPMQIAEELLGHFSMEGLVRETSVARPGFINFRMATEAATEVLRRIAEQGEGWGRTNSGQGAKVLVEFVSANPTGPLHIGHARNVVVGDIAARLYEATGHAVTREYYFNDGGVQMRVLGTTLNLRVDEQLGREVEWPEQYYRGEYMKDIANLMIEELGPEVAGSEHPVQYYTDFATREILKTIDADLKAMGVAFDNWFREISLYENGKVEKTLEEMGEKGLTYDHEGAKWFKATSHGDNRDRVVVKSDGTNTYLLPDIAYNEDKFNRGYDRIINVLGADHFGQVPSLLAAAQALGHPGEKLHYIIYQMVSLLKDGESLKLSTRSGEFITLKEMIDEIGVGVVRFFFAMRSPDSQMTFDWNLAKDTSMENPVYYVQYAHARCCSLFR
ncbi:arginine--tRNA ligase, partial [bacterium]|nr:arginine--tRNA ligase [bacterium]